MLELFEVFVALDVEVHLDAPNEFVEQREGQLMGGNDRPQLAVDRELGHLAGASAGDIRTPGREPGAPLLHTRRFFVGDIVDLAAERVQSGHAVAFGLGQKDEGQREVGGALARDGAAFHHGPRRLALEFWRLGGTLPGRRFGFFRP